jgi:hypothetical protein
MNQSEVFRGNKLDDSIEEFKTETSQNDISFASEKMFSKVKIQF